MNGMDMNTREKQELATCIRDMVLLLNSKIEVANKNGIVVELETKSAYMSSNTPALQVEIYERINL